MNTKHNRFSPFTEEMLRKAGWYPGRQLSFEEMEPWLAFKWESPDSYCRIIPAALRVLREFGGLTVLRGDNKSGVARARANFCIDPLVGMANAPEAVWFDYEWALNTSLYPLGVLLHQGFVLAISQDGKVYWLGNGLTREAETFDQALENLIVGLSVGSQDLDHVVHEPGLMDEVEAIRKAVFKVRSG